MNISEIVATGKRFGYGNALIEVLHRIANKFTTVIIARPMVLQFKDTKPEFPRIDEMFNQFKRRRTKYSPSTKTPISIFQDFMPRGQSPKATCVGRFLMEKQ